jgi:hypothetical protein
MTSSKSKALLLTLLLSLLVAASSRASEPLSEISLQVSDRTVTAAGLTPGSPVVVVCVWHIPDGPLRGISQSWRDAVASDDGQVAATFGNTIPERAFIVVIDVASARVKMTEGEATNFERVDLPAKRLRRDANGDVAAVLSPNERALIVVARRGEGVWTASAYDGGSGDADQSLDGRITTDPAALRPVAGSPSAPKKIRPRDVVILIDAASRLYATTEVEP